MKKYILPLLSIALLTMISCNEETAVEEAATTVIEETPAAIQNVINANDQIKKEAINTAPAVIANPTTLKMDRMEHDFGTITDDKAVTTTFTLTNTGDKPLIITQAKGSCGCTVPTYPQAPIAPGETGSIEVSFNPSGKSGAQNKTVTIIANTEPANTVLNVKSIVNKIAK